MVAPVFLSQQNLPGGIARFGAASGNSSVVDLSLRR
jgi:hypothetical protein